MTTELLAPAGGQEALVAAVQSGADAVYMGFGAFNARRSARNFSDEEFRAAVSYCHLRGVKVYLTLKTPELSAQKTGTFGVKLPDFSCKTPGLLKKMPRLLSENSRTFYC